MNNRYQEVMAHLEVTPSMRQRILHNIASADSSCVSRKHVLLFYVRRLLPAIAACLALLVIAAWLVPYRPIRNGFGEQSVSSGNGIAEAGSLAELSGITGFDIQELQGLPFTVVQTQYTAYGQDLAQIAYTGEGKSVVYRKSPGTEDNSGDYTEYPTCITLSIHSISVQLKGTDELFYLAVWNNGGYSYSVYSENGMNEQELMDLLEDNL